MHRARNAWSVDQLVSSNARRAAATARSMSSVVPAATVPSTSSVEGLTLSNVLPLLAGTSLPSIRWRVSGASGASAIGGPFGGQTKRLPTLQARDLTAVDVQYLTGNPRRGVGEQEQTGVRHAFGLTQPGQRHLRDELRGVI